MVLKDASRDTDSEYPAEPVGPAESRMATSKKVCKAGAYLWALLIASMCHCSHFFLEGYKQANTRPLDKGLRSSGLLPPLPACSFSTWPTGQNALINVQVKNASRLCNITNLWDTVLSKQINMLNQLLS